MPYYWPQEHGFDSRNDSDYAAAVAALDRLDEDRATRAYATSVAERRRKEFLEEEGVREKASTCVRHLHGKRCKHDEWNRGGRRHLYSHTADGDLEEGDYDYCLPAGVDHTVAYTKDGKTTMILSQPYDLQWEELLDLVAWCEVNGAEARIEGRSFYFPGCSMMLIIEKAEEREKEEVA